MSLTVFPYCCDSQITLVRINTIFNLSFTAIKVQIGHQIFIKLRTHKVCYEDPGNKTD